MSRDRLTEYRSKRDTAASGKKDDDGADRRAKPARTKPGSVLSGHVNEDFE